MSLPSAMSQLNDAQKALQAKWDQTRLTWRDKAADRFDEVFIQAIEREIRRSVDAMGTCHQQSIQAKRDCSASS